MTKKIIIIVEITNPDTLRLQNLRVMLSDVAEDIYDDTVSDKYHNRCGITLKVKEQS